MSTQVERDLFMRFPGMTREQIERQLSERLEDDLRDFQFQVLPSDVPHLQAVAADPRPTVYLAGHISADNYRKVATTYLDDYGWEVLDPFVRADFRDRDNLDMAALSEEIVEGDLNDIKRSQAVLADCTIGSPGTSMEIWYANSIGRPVYAFVERGNRISPWVHYVAHEKVEETLSDALVRLVGDYQ